MMGEWKIRTIEEVSAPSPRSIAMGPFGSNIKTDNFVPSGVPVIRGQNLNAERFNESDFVFLTEEKADELVASNAFPGDLVFTHRGTLGQVGIILRDAKYKRYVVSQSQMKLTCDSKQVDSLFLFYFFRSPQGQYELLANTSTTGVPAISRPLTTLKAIKVPVPPLPEQRAIAHILGSLDDKIELNRRMNETLEAMAQAIFKSWFVDFDPVCAKAEGRDTGLPGEIADLFPDSFEDSEMGAVPEGWKATTLNDGIEIFDSVRIPLNKRQRAERQGIYPYYGAASIMDHVDDFLFDGVYVLTGEDGSVADDDGHPVVQYVWGQFWVNNHAHILKGKNGISEEHLYLFLQQTNVAAFVTGAVQPKLNQKNLKAVPLVLPKGPVCRAFSDLIQPLFSKLRANADETATLTPLRDTLLPKLISGELRVPDAEKFIVEGDV